MRQLVLCKAQYTLPCRRAVFRMTSVIEGWVGLPYHQPKPPPCTLTVNTGVQNDARVHWPVDTARGHGCQKMTPVFTGRFGHQCDQHGRIVCTELNTALRLWPTAHVVSAADCSADIHLRSTDTVDYVLPRTRSKSGQSATARPVAWNSLLSNLHDTINTNAAKNGSIVYF